MTTKVIVLSHEHGLLPLAWRLVREGCDVSVSIQRTRFAGAWEGKFHPAFPPGGKDAIHRDLATVTAALDAGAYVLTDSYIWADRLPVGPRVYSTLPAPQLPPLQLLGWLHEGQVVGPVYVAVADLGMWPGGQGPQSHPAAVTLLRVPAEMGKLLLLVDPPPPNGLVRVGLQADEEGKLYTVGSASGWHFGFYHAYVAATGRITSALEGTASADSGIFSVAAPVSIPPWPQLCNVTPAQLVLESLPQQVLAATMWHDVRILGEGKLETAGTDGLVGVVTAAGRHWELCRAALADASGALLARLPGGQFRVDFGQHVPQVLRTLEQLGLGVV